MLTIATCWFQNSKTKQTKKKSYTLKLLLSTFYLSISTLGKKSVSLECDEGEDEWEGVYPFHSEHF